MNISFVIPCYRSAKTIGNVIEEISSTMNILNTYDYEIILVNDYSPDNTCHIISEIARQDSRVTAVNLTKNFGQHAALMAGFHQTTGDIIICLDDDGQTPADEVDKLLERIHEGYDVVYASYHEKRHSGFRNFGSRLNSKMTELMLGKPKDISVTSYFAVKRFIVNEMIRYQYSFPYVIGLVLRSTKNICNVQVTHRARKDGSSGYSFSKLVSLWMNGFTSFSVKPLRVANYFGVFSALCGLCYTLYIVIMYFYSHSAPMGWSSIAAILLILGGIVLIILGIIGEYVGRIYMCVNSAPQFVIRDIVRSKDHD